MRRHLCLFTDSQEPSGVGEHMLTLAALLTDHYRLSFVCPPTAAGLPLLARARELGAETLALSACYHERDALKRLGAWLRDCRVDLFHGHAGIGWEGFGGVEAARAAGVSTIVRTEHLPYLLTHPVQQADHARTVQLVDRLICVSAEAGASYLQAGVPPRKLRVIRNGIPLRRVEADRAGVRARLGLPADAQLVITVGRFSEQKGHRYLLAALPGILARQPAATFLWVGEGDLADELRAQVEAQGLAEQVRFLGRRADVPDLLAAADLFVLPSLFEGLPLALLEAMAAGLPVVGTRVCGTSEAIRDGITGCLVPPQDAAALTAAILQVLEQPALAARWGAAGRDWVAREFSAERMGREVVAVYEEGVQDDEDTNRLYRGRGHRRAALEYLTELS